MMKERAVEFFVKTIAVLTMVLVLATGVAMFNPVSALEVDEDVSMGKTPGDSDYTPPTYTGDITIVKVDGDTQVRLEGAKFEVIGTASGQTTIVETDENGEAHLDNLSVELYEIKEIEAPVGYELDSTIQTVEFTSLFNLSKEVSFENFKTPEYSVEILKVDSETEEALEGAIFTLMSNDEIVATDLVSDENGLIVIDGLTEGEYVLIETEAPEGYELSDEEIAFVVNEETTFNNVLEITVSNVKVVVEIPSTPLEPATPVEPEEEIPLTPLEPATPVEPETPVVPEIPLTPLVPATPVEPETPVVPEIPLTPLEPATPVEPSVPEVVVPEEVLYNLNIVKKDLDTNEVLANAIFDLLDSEGNVLLSGLVSDANGVIFVEGLLEGTYYLVETEAPVNYVILFDEILIDLSAETVDENNTLEVVVFNQELETEGYNPPTEETPEEPVIEIVEIVEIEETVEVEETPELPVVPVEEPLPQTGESVSLGGYMLVVMGGLFLLVGSLRKKQQNC